MLVHGRFTFHSNRGGAQWSSGGPLSLVEPFNSLSPVRVESPTPCGHGSTRLEKPFAMSACVCALDGCPEAGDMLNCVHKRHRLAGTGFTKVTIVLNNPTPIHIDHGNIGRTALLFFDASLEGEKLIGGSHTIHSPDLSQA
eukprot:5475099-Pleurochrysis_carterae.AAC.1